MCYELYNIQLWIRWGKALSDLTRCFPVILFPRSLSLDRRLSTFLRVLLLYPSIYPKIPSVNQAEAKTRKGLLLLLESIITYYYLTYMLYSSQSTVTYQISAQLGVCTTAITITVYKPTTDTHKQIILLFPVRFCK